MAEELSYEFDNFRLDPVRRNLFYGSESRPLTPTAFDLLIAFVQKHGQTLSKTDLIKLVWNEASVTDNNFNVTLAAVRRALGESARESRHIIKTPNGYRFVTNVREIRVQAPDHTQVRHTPDDRTHAAAVASRPKYLGHVLTSSVLYAALYATCLLLEVAYEFDRFGGEALLITPLIFTWMTICAVVGLMVDRKLTSQGRPHGLAISVAIFFLAAGLLCLVLTRFLPPFPITQSTLQSYPAQAAYLKDTTYFLIAALVFLLLPFHFIVTVEHSIQRGHCSQMLGVLTGDKLSVPPAGTIYPRFWALASLLVILAAFSLVMTSRLLDHLKPGPYLNLFTQLVYLRAILYFGLGVECLLWYYRALNSAKRQCLAD
jgi:DNA-binding winged helix-turn-helix (wHTH) protein